MAFAKACAADELWEGDMVEVDVNDHVVVLVWPTGGEIHAYQGICPHQDIPLAEGKFDGRVLTSAHISGPSTAIRAPALIPAIAS